MMFGTHWRPLTTLDLPAVEAIAAVVHPGFPEDMAVFAERQRLYPAGARLLEIGGRASGYLISHPFKSGHLPTLNTLLGALPVVSDTFYIHDLALLPAARGSGAAGEAVAEIVAHAARAGFGEASLVAVNGSVPFWRRHGFAQVDVPELRGKLGSYEDAARYMVRQLAGPAVSG